MTPVITWLANSWIVLVLDMYVAVFPVALAMLAIDSSRQFFLDRRGIVTQRLEPTGVDLRTAEERWPIVTVVIPAHNEAGNLRQTVEAAVALEWPFVDVVIVDDGSTDATRQVAHELAAAHARGLHTVRVIDRDENHGKAAALNLALETARGELFLELDADAMLSPDVVELMAAQLAHHDDLAAVTGNPRSFDTARLISKLQAIEFCSTVSTQRRGHAAWGRVSTLSGVCSLYRTSALREIGGFDPVQPTEDIEITWRLQVKGWRAGYEPSALVGTYLPTTLRGWGRQRARWARGLVCALRLHGRAAARQPKMWTLLFESAGSIVWCHLIVLMTAFWGLCLATGAPVAGNSILLSRWGAFTLAVSCGQVAWGMRLDRREDPRVVQLWPFIPLFPLVYWVMSAAVVVWVTIPTLVRPPRTDVRWVVSRTHAPAPVATRATRERPGR